MAAGVLPLGFLALLLLLCASELRAADTIAAGRALSGGQTLVSAGGKFALGFFQPGRGRWYIGIWYHNIPVQTPVWVANRDIPVPDLATSRLAVTPDGNLALFDGRRIVWSTQANTSGIANASDTAMVAVLLDTGNLVLAPASNTSAMLWQSFDHVGDTWLPGGRLRRDKLTGEIKRMVSWRSTRDPAPGNYAIQLDPSGSPQYALLANGTRQYWASGNWTGQFFSGLPELAANSGGLASFEFVDNDEESYFTYGFTDNRTVHRFVMDVAGQLNGLFWVDATKAWNLVFAEPKGRCVVPGVCGAFGVCSETASTPCDCARGFSPAAGALGGCTRDTQLQCARNDDTEKVEQDKFLCMDDMRLPDEGRVMAEDARSGDDCRGACLAHCTCSAYAYNGTCFLWHHDLFNLQDGVGAGMGKSLYLRLAASELPDASAGRNHKWRRIKTAFIAVGMVCSAIAASLLLVHTTRKRRSAKIVSCLTIGDGTVTSFKYRELKALTNNFSAKIGGGGFGSVFKGHFSDNTVVAIKKLEGSGQGEKQFRAEVSTLGTIQHVNLIRMLGFCSEGGDRKLLVYEYMPNGSLDRYLFRKTFCRFNALSWRARYQVALGVAKALAYLHDRCRDCIIHCDIKPENILLDASFTPKVADFGLAKLVGRDFSKVLTAMRGTIGYLAPEWISGEAITAKADVFSYGMTLFEIVSGRRNFEQGRHRRFDIEMSSLSTEDEAGREHAMSIFPLLVAKRLLEEGDVMALLDPELEGEANAEELMRVCKVAGWCIQHGVDARPTMAKVVQVLEGLTDFEVPPWPTYLAMFDGESIHETTYRSVYYTADEV